MKSYSEDTAAWYGGGKKEQGRVVMPEVSTPPQPTRHLKGGACVLYQKTQKSQPDGYKKIGRDILRPSSKEDHQTKNSSSHTRT